MANGVQVGDPIPDGASIGPQIGMAIPADATIGDPPSKPKISSMADYAKASPAEQQAYLSSLPGNVGKEPRAVTAGKLAGQGDYSGAAHQVIAGAGEGLAPVAAGALMTSPAATLVGAAGGAGGQQLAKMGARYLGASPSQQDLAGDAGALAAGSVGAKIGSVIDSIGERVSDPGVLRSALRGVLSKYISSDVARAVLPEPGDELASAIKAGTAAKIPIRMPKPPAEAGPAPAGTLTSAMPVNDANNFRIPQPQGTSSITSTGSIADLPSNAKPSPAVDELTQAIREGRAAKIPIRMLNKATPAQVDELTAAIKQGIASRIPTRMPKIPESPVPTDIPTSVQQVSYGNLMLPSPADFYAARGAELMRRDPVKLSTLASASAPDADSESALSGSGDDLISRTKALVKPGVEPTAADLKRAGDLTQAPLSKLQQLAKFGDKLAQLEINRRLKN